MRNKYFTLIMTFAIVLCIFCTSVTVLATGDETTNAPTEAPATTQTPPEPTTQNNNPGGLVDDEDETTTKRTTTTEPIIVTENNTTTTRRNTSSSTTTTRRNPNNSSNTTTTRRTDTDRTTRAESTESTDPTLPEGQFYVHLVLGNGENDKKTVMKKAGLVSAPAEPKWDGHIFEGWYSDPAFKNPWDFSKDKATKEMTIYAKWSVDAASVFYTITVTPVKGGKITVSPATASVGTPIIITVKPDSGKRLADGSLTVNGEKKDVLSFEMPAEDVVISARFEDIPASVGAAEEKDNSVMYILIGAGVLVVALIVVGVIMLRRKNEIIVPEFDENGAVIIDDDEEVWVDESLVIESAFPDAKPASATDVTDRADAVTAEKVNKYQVITDEAFVDDNDAKLVEAVEDVQSDADDDDSTVDFSLFE